MAFLYHNCRFISTMKIRDCSMRITAKMGALYIDEREIGCQDFAFFKPKSMNLQGWSWYGIVFSILNPTCMKFSFSLDIIPPSFYRYCHRISHIE